MTTLVPAAGLKNLLLRWNGSRVEKAQGKSGRVPAVVMAVLANFVVQRDSTSRVAPNVVRYRLHISHVCCFVGWINRECDLIRLLHQNQPIMCSGALTEGPSWRLSMPTVI